MKQIKRILAFFTVILLLLPLTGCLVPKDNAANEPAPSDAGVTGAPESSEAAAFDRNAIAIELGDIQITAEELENTFSQYVSYFAYSYGMDEESLNQFMRMTEEWLIEFYMPEWKAKQLGVSLSAEQEAQCSAEAQAEVDEERDALLYYYGDPDGSVEDVSQLSEEQRTAALNEINEELAAMFGEGYTFDDYLAMRLKDAVSTKRIDALSTLLEEQFGSDAPADQTAIDEWYETTLAKQKETFTEDPATYLDYQNGVALVDDPICLYAPKEAARIEVILILSDDSDLDTLDETRSAVAELEAEYGALVLRGENEDRQAEIVTEYAALRETLETLEKQHTAGVKETADKAYADLLGGMTFADAMELYNAHDDEGGGRFEQVVFLDGNEPEYPAYAEIASKLTVGAYSEPTPVGDDYCIVRLTEILPEGVIDRASIENEIDAFVSEKLRTETWQAQHDAWLEEAKNAAVYHREVYDMLIRMYLG